MQNIYVWLVRWIFFYLFFCHKVFLVYYSSRAELQSRKTGFSLTNCPVSADSSGQIKQTASVMDFPIKPAAERIIKGHCREILPLTEIPAWVCVHMCIGMHGAPLKNKWKVLTLPVYSDFIHSSTHTYVCKAGSHFQSFALSPNHLSHTYFKHTHF